MRHFFIYSFIIVLLISCGKKVLSIPDTASPEERLKVEQANETYTSEAYVSLARYFKTAGNTPRALESYRLAHELDTANYTLRFEYGNFAYLNDYQNEGLKQFKHILNSSHSNTYFNRIMPYFITFDVKKLTNTTWNNAFPSFTNDGKSVVFQTDEHGNWDIKRVYLDSDSSEFLVRSPANEEGPSFSPDLKKLVYTTDKFDTRIVDASQKWREIMMLDLNLNQIQRLTLNYCDDYYPRFSKENDQIIFVSERADVRQIDYGQRHTNLYIMDSDGSFQVPLTKGDVYDQSGYVTEKLKTTIFSSKAPQSTFKLLEKTNSIKTVDTLLVYSGKNILSVDGTPDRTKVVFVSDKSGNNDLFMYNTISMQDEQLTFHPADDNKPSISPDGEKIVFHSNRDGFYNLYLIDLTKRSEEPTVENVLNKINQKLNSLTPSTP